MRSPRRARAPLTIATTHEVRDTCLCLHAQRAARRIARRFDAALRPLGLTNGQFSLLMSVQRDEPPTIGAVAELLGMDRTTLTALLKPLAKRRLVALRADPADGRARRLALRPAGARVLVAALAVWRLEHAAVERALASDPDRLRADLRALGGALSGTAGEPAALARPRAPDRMRHAPPR